MSQQEAVEVIIDWHTGRAGWLDIHGVVNEHPIAVIEALKEGTGFGDLLALVGDFPHPDTNAVKRYYIHPVPEIGETAVELLPADADTDGALTLGPSIDPEYTTIEFTPHADMLALLKAASMVLNYPVEGIAHHSVPHWTDESQTRLRIIPDAVTPTLINLVAERSMLSDGSIAGELGGPVSADSPGKSPQTHAPAQPEERTHFPDVSPEEIVENVIRYFNEKLGS